jgi:hypothetical protein
VIEWVLVRVDLSPLVILAIGLVVYGVARRGLDHRWRERRRDARAHRAASAEGGRSLASAASADQPAPSTVEVGRTSEASTRPWWRGSVGVVPIAVGLVMIVGHGAVERAFGAVVAAAASLFLPTH